MIFSAVAAALGIVIYGATYVRSLYMHPILMVAPVYVFARIARLTRDGDTVNRFAAVAVMTMIFMLGFRFVAASNNFITRSMHRGLLLPYEELAHALKARGMAEGTMLGVAVRDVGNLRAFFPNLRAMASDSFRIERPPLLPSNARACAVIWRSGQETQAAKFAEVDKLQAERVDIGRETWFVARLDPLSHACR
jgi:hypothetical protein